MSEGTPLSRLPRRVNPRKLAYSGVSLEGSVDAKLMLDITKVVDSIENVVASLEFLVNEEGKWAVKGVIEADIMLECQRCMQPTIAQHLKVDVNALIVRTEEEAKQIASSVDPWLVTEDEANLVGHIEEELILEIPAVAYHDFECIDPELLSSGDTTDVVEEEKQNPFDVLAALKKSPDKD